VLVGVVVLGLLLELGQFVVVWVVVWLVLGAGCAVLAGVVGLVCFGVGVWGCLGFLGVWLVLVGGFLGLFLGGWGFVVVLVLSGEFGCVVWLGVCCGGLV
ncbi:hypothetical protein RA276_28200, partial [Pseudomonas syringae pv. tagetis]|uniref:hypothetical protein n=1 Tax=Pseudomonas syringae group genomosp. 7 TaxID=251699 RepID=UPI0037704C13